MTTLDIIKKLKELQAYARSINVSPYGKKSDIISRITKK